ncbi:MAG TPA: EAL domain-containing protein [Devosiaceae bacterium]|jgi:EAL domain-containing protein (putative c-di-GMP-specific phosphodiesterase class I)|nr:EAL domain-containing protein [Devosiaceae bacterium]
MFKGLRNLFQRLEELDAEEAAAAAGAAPPSGAAARSSASRSLVLDPDAASARSLAALLGGSGIECEVFEDAAAFAAACAAAPPALLFIDVGSESDTAIDVLVTLSEQGYEGMVQLLGAGPLPVVEVVRRMGERHGLTMLPVLEKPLAPQAVRQVLEAAGLECSPPDGAATTLAEALAQDWIEFWYQPKIDLRHMQIAGVETFARVRHPHLGMLAPHRFMEGATEAELTLLTRQALVSALGAAASFSELGINLRVAVNVPVPALLQLPIPDLVRECGPSNGRWPGLLLDVTEAQVVAELPRVQALADALAACNVRLAIDDFGRGMLPVGKLRQLPFLELKLDRSFVHGCAADAARAETCRKVIALAHGLDCVAVAVGIEKAADMRALAAMGCGLGQGYLFGPPMPQQDLVAAVLERAVRPGSHAAARRRARSA